VPPAVQNYILDACALLALFDDEKGADIVENLLDRAKNNEITITMNAANLIEVYYDRIRKLGTKQADAVIQNIYDTFPISIIENLNPAIVREAAHLKAVGKMSFADTILVATARYTGATIVTSDYVELEPVEQQGHIPFLWIRPQF
jgi:predicted nucleic acid-binding protein